MLLWSNSEHQHYIFFNFLLKIICNASKDNFKDLHISSHKIGERPHRRRGLNTLRCQIPFGAITKLETQQNPPRTLPGPSQDPPLPRTHVPKIVFHESTGR